MNSVLNTHKSTNEDFLEQYCSFDYSQDTTPLSRITRLLTDTLLTTPTTNDVGKDRWIKKRKMSSGTRNIRESLLDLFNLHPNDIDMLDDEKENYTPSTVAKHKIRGPQVYQRVPLAPIHLDDIFSPLADYTPYSISRQDSMHEKQDSVTPIRNPPRRQQGIQEQESSVAQRLIFEEANTGAGDRVSFTTMEEIDASEELIVMVSDLDLRCNEEETRISIRNNSLELPIEDAIDSSCNESIISATRQSIFLPNTLDNYSQKDFITVQIFTPLIQLSIDQAVQVPCKLIIKNTSAYIIMALRIQISVYSDKNSDKLVIENDENVLRKALIDNTGAIEFKYDEVEEGVEEMFDVIVMTKGEIEGHINLLEANIEYYIQDFNDEKQIIENYILKLPSSMHK